MTDRKDRLIKLLAKVEASSNQWSANEIFEAIGRHKQKHFNAAFHGSLDAAKALHEAVLPVESKWQLTWADGSYDFAVSHSGMVYGTYITDNPARAWLIAILKALIACENTNANDKGE
jgi:hypothetical protein